VLPHNTKFLLSLELALLTGTQLRAVNVYNPPGSTLGTDQLQLWFDKVESRTVAAMIGIDSNLHHDLWNLPGYHHVHQSAESLITMCGQKGFRIISDKHTPTFVSIRGSCTTIELTWANLLALRLVRDTTTSSNNHGLDHHHSGAGWTHLQDESPTGGRH
jgi:hypothetical protein